MNTILYFIEEKKRRKFWIIRFKEKIVRSRWKISSMEKHQRFYKVFNIYIRDIHNNKYTSVFLELIRDTFYLS